MPPPICGLIYAGVSGEYVDELNSKAKMIVVINLMDEWKMEEFELFQQTIFEA